MDVGGAPPRKRACTSARRLNDICDALELLVKGNPRTVEVERPGRTELCCGAVVSSWSIRYSRLYDTVFSITMILTVENGCVLRTRSPNFEVFVEAANWIRSFMEGARLCKECHTVEVEHRCASRLRYLFWGEGEPEMCSICQEDCLGITVTRCAHVFHKTCLERVRDNKCPNCREALEVLEIRGDSDSDVGYGSP